MKRLWVAFIVIATLGSIYPFDFSTAGLDAASFRAFARSIATPPGLGDLVGNVVLFLPFGFAGALIAGHDGARRRFLPVLVYGAVFALLLQVAQLALPSRDQNLQDVIWNSAGTAIGAALAVAYGRLLPRAGVAAPNLALVPLGLLAAFLVYRLIPFVPSIDWQLIKDSVKPLAQWRFDPAAASRDFVSWVVAACLLRNAWPGSRLDNWLPLLVAATFALEVLIVFNAVDGSDVAGAAAALVAWFVVLRPLPRHATAVTVILCASLLYSGLVPFSLRDSAGTFHWLPFHGFLGGAMYVNAQSAMEKVFLYGSLVFLVRRSVLGARAGLGFAAALVLGIEIAQTMLDGHTAEITDPLLLVLAAVAMAALAEPRATATPADGAAANTGSMSETLRFRGHDWQRLRVNLLRDQFDFLKQLAREMNVSTSHVVRQVVQRFLAESSHAGSDTASVYAPETSERDATTDPVDTAATGVQAAWVNQTINLHRYQLDFIDELAHELGVSRSAVVRRIVIRFIEDSDSAPA